jgi:hypothetical protein
MSNFKPLAVATKCSVAVPLGVKELPLSMMELTACPLSKRFAMRGLMTALGIGFRLILRNTDSSSSFNTFEISDAIVPSPLTGGQNINRHHRTIANINISTLMVQATVP